jgi:hypothetical protein
MKPKIEQKIFRPNVRLFLYGSKLHGFTPEKGPTKKVTTSSIFKKKIPAIDSCDENRLMNT